MSDIVANCTFCKNGIADTQVCCGPGILSIVPAGVSKITQMKN